MRLFDWLFGRNTKKLAAGRFAPASSQEVLKGAAELPSRLELLLSGLDSYNKDKSIQSIKALGELKDEHAVKPLLSFATDQASLYKAEVCSAAFDALVAIGPPAVEPLIDATTSSNVDIQRRAVKALHKLGDSRAIPALTAAICARNPEVRLAAAEALGQLGDESCSGVLSATLEDSYGGARAAAAAALAQVALREQQSGKAVNFDALVRAAGTGDDALREAARNGLRALNWKPKNASEQVALAVSSGQYNDLPLHDPAIVLPLAEALKSTGEPLALLGEIGDERCIGHLVEYCAKQKPDTWKAIKVLRKILYRGAQNASVADLRAVSKLKDFRQLREWNLAWNHDSNFESVSTAAVVWLAYEELLRRNKAGGISKPIDPRQLATECLATLRSDDYNRASDAARTLGQLGLADACPTLIERLNSVRALGYQVVRALGSIGDVSAVPSLLKMAQEVSGEPARVVEALGELLRDNSSTISIDLLQSISDLKSAKGSAVDGDYKSYTYKVSCDPVSTLAVKILSERESAP